MSKPATRRQATLDALRQSRPKIMKAREIAAMVYADCPGGGPFDAENCVRVMIRNLRELGHNIVTWKSRGYQYLEATEGAELTHPPGIVVQSPTTHERIG